MIQTLLLAYAGPGRTVVVFEPTYQLHAHIARITGATVVAGDRRDDFTLDPDDAASVRRARTTRRSRSCARRTTRPVWSSRPTCSTPCSTRRPGSSSSTRPTPSSRRGRRSTASPTTAASSSCARSRRRGAWRRPGSATSSAPSWLVAQLDKVVLPYHLDAAKQLAGTGRPAPRRRHGATGELARRGARPGDGRRSPNSRERRGVPVGRQLRARALRTATTPGTVWQRLVDGGVLIRDCSGWSRLDGCLRVTIGLPAENDRFLAALATALSHGRRVTAHGAACAPQSTARRPRRRRSTSRSTSTARAATDVSTGIPFYDHMLDQLGRHGGFDLTVAADRRPAHRHPPHGRGRRDHARRGVRRGARRQGRRAPLRQRPVPARRGARRGRPRPVRPAVRGVGRRRCPRACRSATRRSIRSSPSTPCRRSPRTPASRCTSRLRAGRNVHHIIEATFKGLARCLRDAVRIEAAAEGVPSTKGVL